MKMQALRLDYVADGRSSRTGMAILFSGILVLSGAAWHYIDVVRRADYQEAILSGVRHVSRKPEKIDGARLVSSLKSANEVTEALNRPWNALFVSFESVPHQDVAILAIDPDVRKKVVRIAGEAKSLDALLVYLANLQKSSPFRNVAMQSHQVRNQDPEKPVRFMIQAKWVEDHEAH